LKIKVKQRDITDCGAACLASVAAWYKLSLPVAKIRQMASTDRKGTNVLGLVEAAGKIGFLAKGVRGEWDSLFKIPKPAIAHVIVKKRLQHYVVLIKTGDRHIEIMDPADGEIHRLEHGEFREMWTGVLVIMTPGEKFRAGSSERSNESRFLQLIKPNRGVLVQALAGALLYSVLGLGMSVYVGKLVDNVLPGSNTSLLNLLGLTMVVIILLRLVLGLLQTLFVMKTGQKIDATLILGYYQHLLKLPQAFFDNMRTGEIISRIADAVKIRVFINDVAISLILNVFILIVSLVLMFTFYLKLALIVLAALPLFFVVYLVSDRLNRKVQRKVMERSADLEAQLVESLNSAGTIKRFGLEDFSNFRTEVRFVGLLEILYRSGINSIITATSSGLLTQIFMLAVLWAGSYYVIGSKITAGELLAFYSVSGYFTGPVSGIIGFNRTYQDAKIAADRLFEIFDLEIDEPNAGMELTGDLAGDIRFENVKFRYGTRTEVFDSLDLVMRRGRVTAIVGESGSGKSTIVSLLHNLYPLQSGHIRIGAHDLRHFSGRSVRKIISVVPQKIDLFAGSVIENIAVGELSPDMEKILDICRQLGMTEFIDELPAGYNTLLGENGATLSGGQRQRIAIARALYRDPEILVLDEATSSLDPASEDFVKRAVAILRKRGKTVILIAHRLSTVSVADNIIVLEKGRVVQEGSQEELSREDGRYKEMLRHQVFVLSENDQ
jgi:ATP-binding cassette, subfamily C, bacteriocin exporter